MTQRTVLNVGCGPRHASMPLPPSHFRPGEWRELRLDVDPAVAPDIVASITDMAEVATAAVDAVWSSHNLEHLHDYEVPVALREFARVLKPSGFVLIAVPDIQQAATMIAAGNADLVAYVSPAGPITPLDILFGYRRLTVGNAFMAHRTGFTDRRLARALREAGFGFVDVRRDMRFGFWGLARNGRGAPACDSHCSTSLPGSAEGG